MRTIDPAPSRCGTARTAVASLQSLLSPPDHQLAEPDTPTPECTLLHQSAALIRRGCWCSKRRQTLYIYVDRFKLHILCIPQRKTRLLQSIFKIKQFSDYIGYIVLVMKSMGMNQETSQVVLQGYIGKNSPHYEEFVSTSAMCCLGTRLQHLKFGYLFDEIQDHHYLDSYSHQPATRMKRIALFPGHSILSQRP